ncbi:MAG: hypothetical protein ABIW83_08265 [Allosphingosinicella sp.]
MIDTFSLALTHGLLALVAWRLMFRTDLNEDPAPGTEPAAPKSRRWTLGKGRPDA